MAFRCVSVLVLLVLFTAFCTGESAAKRGIKCLQCKAAFCAENHTHIQDPCPHFDNVCYTLRNPKTHKVVKKGCGEQDVCEVYSACSSCKKDLCNTD